MMLMPDPPPSAAALPLFAASVTLLLGGALWLA